MNAHDKGCAAPASLLSVPLTVSEDVVRMKQALLKNIQRSAYVYRVDCGGCNGCEIEIFAALTPIFDAERFGIKVVASPRHADILLFTGAVTRAMRAPAIRAYQAAPDPKIVVSYGACGCGGGIFHDLYCVWGGTEEIVPVDVYIPGCPPTPLATIHGFAVALGLLEQKLKASHQTDGDLSPVQPVFANVPLDLRVALEREARRMVGYREAHRITAQYLEMLQVGAVKQSLDHIQGYLTRENDPRLTEVVSRLNEITQSVLR
jgi:hydrogenase-4 component I